MAGFFNKLKAGATNSKSDNSSTAKNKKEEPAAELTPLEKLLQGAGPLREDGSDKFFGLENFGNTCYCNSIVQALYYSEPFRENVVNYPPHNPLSEVNGGQPSKVNVSIRAPVQTNGQAVGAGKGQKGVTNAQALKQRQALNAGQLGPTGQPLRPEDRPDSPEYKKKQAMIKGPVLELSQDNPDAYGMQECTFTGLKDIFTALIESNSRTGVLSPQRFLDIFKRDNEMFRNSMHQDAHEFYGLVLNDVITNVEANGKRLQEKEAATAENSLIGAMGNVIGATSQTKALTGTGTPGTGWVHDIFEGVLTSETKCLTCETASQRDETFLDLSIDLEEHSSVTSCLRKFSAEEMLCERNKFHCDHCGGLQEAEKRMKIKKLPKVLALHLKRFKYTEDYSRLQKLFHRVVYPYHLRMFNTTDETEDPDRMYELYAVVVHIGGNAYHGHYVSVIKTKDRGWLLFDDEMVEPVDKHFVRNFFGDKPGQACAYVLFYQETSFEKVREEQESEGLEEVRLASQKADIALGVDKSNGTTTTPLSKLNSQPTSPADDLEPLVTLNHAKTAPGDIRLASPIKISPVLPAQVETRPLINTPAKADEAASTTPAKSKDEIAKDKKELKAQEKARKAAEKEQAKLEEKQRLERQSKLRAAQRSEQEQLDRALKESKAQQALEEKKRKDSSANGENGEHKSGFLNRASRGSKSMTKKSFAFLGKGSNSEKSADKSDKSVKSSRSDRSDSNAGAAGSEAGRASSSQPLAQAQASVPPPQQQNGASVISNHSPTAQAHPQQQQEKPPLPPVPEADKPPLKERFSFGLGRKKSSRFLS